MAVDEVLVPASNHQLHQSEGLLRSLHGSCHTAKHLLIHCNACTCEQPSTAAITHQSICSLDFTGWQWEPDLSGDCDLIKVLILHRPIGLVRVVEDY